jgi:hypothetical protein
MYRSMYTYSPASGNNNNNNNIQYGATTELAHVSTAIIECYSKNPDSSLLLLTS